MRYRPSKVSRAKANKLARTLKLSRWRTNLLYCELNRARWSFDINAAIKVTAPPQIARTLTHIERSFERITKFASSPDRPDRDARHELKVWTEKVLHRWQPSKDNQLVRALGLEPSRIMDTLDLDYAASVKMEQWLFASHAMLRAVRSTRLRMLRSARWQSRTTARQELVCEELPRIYRRLTDKEIHASYNDLHEIWYGGEFICAALTAMRLPSITSKAFAQMRRRYRSDG